jgi:hypothetical protein
MFFLLCSVAHISVTRFLDERWGFKKVEEDLKRDLMIQEIKVVAWLLTPEAPSAYGILHRLSKSNLNISTYFI